MTDILTTTPQLDWLLGTPVASFEHLIFARQETIPFPGNHGATAHATGRRAAVAQVITCADGTTLSVQASRTHYCSPRTDDGPWDEVEVGFPSVEVPEWREYRDGPAADTDNVFSRVPVELVRAFIHAHGGERQ